MFGHSTQSKTTGREGRVRWRWRRCASNEGDGDDAIFAMAEFAWATLRERGVHDLPRTEFAPHFERWLLLRYDLPKPSTAAHHRASEV